MKLMIDDIYSDLLNVSNKKKYNLSNIFMFAFINHFKKKANF